MGYFKPHISLNIDSSKRTSGTIENGRTLLSHQIVFSQSPLKCYFLRLENIQLPCSFYQLNSSVNTFRVIETDGVTNHTLTISIDEGNYTILELITELEAGLNAASSSSGDSNTYTINYDDITNKISLTFVPGTSTSVTVDSIANGSTMNAILGIGKADTDTLSGQDNTLVLSPSTASTVYNSIDLLTTKYIDVETSITSNNHYNKDGQISIGARVPIITDRNTIQYFSNHEGHMTKMNNKGPITEVSLRLKLPNGELANLNNVDYNCELTIYELTKSDKKSGLIGGNTRGSIGPSFTG